ncbi:hypothetical protein [Glycomyces buryatensis]|uniref:DUF4760 domain-containing protein n=1 Tax=Glycomyces buryatensis TaxID=2570927 RepID=A0A4S8QK92_9ACTN|nr:hypothetical protein [Glycomyces buryatensis]THV41164.1 hypothetical protein FAB82_13010 [Glycomyces buryatensis]
MITGIVTSAVVVALLTGIVNISLAWRKSRSEERDRIRTVFAEAFAAYTEYREYPYAIRRRNADSPGEERIRISEKVRETQERLSYYLAWAWTESTAVGEAYSDLVSATRRIAGGAMREAWQAPPITEDREMNIPAALVDLAALARYEESFMAAVHMHLLTFTPWPVRVLRALRSRRHSLKALSSSQRPVPQENSLSTGEAPAAG